MVREPLGRASENGRGAGDDRADVERTPSPESGKEEAEQARTDPIIVEVEMLRVPCGHLVERPRPIGKHWVVCPKGHKWWLQWDGTGTWAAKRA